MYKYVSKMNYNEDMNLSTHQIFPDEFRSESVYRWAFSLGLVYIILALAQLFTFEKFAGAIGTYGVLGGSATAPTLAVLLTMLEVISVPYLLSMKLNDSVRVFSKASALLTGLSWLCIALITNIAPVSNGKSFLFGATIPLPNGWWMIVVALALVAAGTYIANRLPARR